MKKFIYIILIHLFLFSTSYADKIEKFSINGNSRVSDKTVILFSKAKINQIINEDDINDFIKNLYQTDFFKEVNIKFKNNILTFNVIENPIIQSIQINGIKDIPPLHLRWRYG